MKNEHKDHTVLFVLSSLIGILITITLLIIVSAYNNNLNIDRDKYYADHCATVSKSPKDNSQQSTPTYRYECGVR